MDRFIEIKKNNENEFNGDLKSNMDRFIGPPAANLRYILVI